jgi:hypothetical protein
MRNTPSLRKCIWLYWGVMSNRLSLHTMAANESNVNMQCFLWNDLDLSICFSIVISFIYFNMELLRKNKIPFILWSWHHPWSACLHYWQIHIVCKQCELSASSGIVSKTNFSISFLHIYMRLKSQGCRFLTVYLWCDSHWNVGTPKMRRMTGDK